MQKRTARRTDYEKLYDFYRRVTEQQASDTYGPDWHLGIYPSAQDLKDHIANKEFYIGLIDEEIAAAGVLTGGEDPIYAKANWPIRHDDEQITVLHLFAVDPKQRGKGCSGEMLKYLITKARKKGFKAIHLDVVEGNLPAEKLYRKHGFEYTQTIEVCYEDTGLIRVDLFSRELTVENDV